MKNKLTLIAAGIFIFFNSNIHAQLIEKYELPEVGDMSVETYSVVNPEITIEQYGTIEKRCAENALIYGIDVSEKSEKTTLLSWPVQAAATLTDCSFYYVSAYVDQNTSAGTYIDYNCGTRSYDGHRGTDIATTPFGFYKMDHSLVEIIAAAPGIILDKHDGEFDRNCATNSLPANYVIIQHSDGSRALYWHMKSGSVTTKAVGQAVVTGEYLGCVGSSGSSTGPHLHFEVWTGSTNATYIDPYFGTCNTINTSSWWASQKNYTEPAVVKASVHTTDIVIPGCPTTETPNESTIYEIPFQGPGLAPGYAKFYAFFRNTTVGINAEMKILNPGGTTFNTWTYSPSSNYSNSYAGYSKLLPTIPGIYTFQVTYNGVSCSQNFEIVTTTDVGESINQESILVSPNPANENLFVTLPEKIDKNNLVLSLYSVQGALIQKLYPASDSELIQFDIHDFEPAMYLLTIETNKSIFRTKFLKN